MNWFPGFCKRYMLRASWSGTDDEDRLLQWLALFQKHQVTEAEADAAALALMGKGFPPIRGNHAAAMIAEIKAIRAEESERSRAQKAREAQDCTDCGGSGLVSVPHPTDFDKEGQWKGKRTASVICSCPAREKWIKFQTTDKAGFRAGIGTIEKYESFCPNWRAWMEWQRQEIEARQRREGASGADRTPFRKVLDRMVTR